METTEKKKNIDADNTVFEIYSSNNVKKVKYVMRCAIWYRLYNLKNLKNTHGGVLLYECLLRF